ncbi:cell division topological specificity factor MinE [Myxococcota bacterium]|jgi:cell division topological specificity factor|nr:cell division topological specificity factor MinE [Myxococcota bacterium]
MKDLFNRFFGGRNAGRSKDEAKQRLKFLLIHDQVDLTPAQLETMKNEILEVIGRYVEIDAASTEFKLEKAEDCIALVSSVPVRRVVERPASAPPTSGTPVPA